MSDQIGWMIEANLNLSSLVCLPALQSLSNISATWGVYIHTSHKMRQVVVNQEQKLG